MYEYLFFIQEKKIISDYQYITSFNFLVDKKLGVCRQEVNFLPTNS